MIGDPVALSTSEFVKDRMSSWRHPIEEISDVIIAWNLMDSEQRLRIAQTFCLPSYADEPETTAFE